MRVVGAGHRRARRRRRKGQDVELCGGLRHPAQVPGKQLRTANFSQDDRERLGKEVAKARRAAGFRGRRAFAEVAKVGKRSIDAVELFEPTVGEDVLQAVGRTLGGYFEDWNEDTPRSILMDGVTPSNIRWQAKSASQGTADEASTAGESASPETGMPDPSLYPDVEDFLAAVIVYLRKQGMSEKAILRAVVRTVEEYEQTTADTERDGPDTQGGRVS